MHLRTLVALGSTLVLSAVTLDLPLGAQIGQRGARPTAPPQTAPAILQYVTAPTGNEARYLVKEQLAGVSFPNDAIGRTSALTGMVTLDKAGKIIPDQSTFTVDLTTLKSDADMRDRYIGRSTLDTAKFPKVELVVKEVRGLTFPLPSSGTATFELLGDLTVRDVTKPTTWQVKATMKDGGLAGTASTRFTFADFNMTKPRVARVLSVEDDIRLEYDFALVPKTGAGQ